MKKNRAFSLVELSIVILVVGILIAGITQSSRLVMQMRLSSARSLTQSSDISGIKDLLLWLDTTAENSVLGATNGVNVEDTERVQTWNDVNPQGVSKISFTQGTNNYRPTYKTKGINNLPTLYFNATSSANGNGFSPTSSLTFSDELTAFVVMQPIDSISANSKILDATDGTNNFYIDIQSASSKERVGTSTTVQGATALTLSTNYITSVVIPKSGSTGTLYRNGASQNTFTSGMASFTAQTYFSIGSLYNSYTSNNFDGYLSEIIIYGRALKTEERQAVEKYLGKKYGITI